MRNYVVFAAPGASKELLNISPQAALTDPIINRHIEVNLER